MLEHPCFIMILYISFQIELQHIFFESKYLLSSDVSRETHKTIQKQIPCFIEKIH